MPLWWLLSFSTDDSWKRLFHVIGLSCNPCQKSRYSVAPPSRRKWNDDLVMENVSDRRVIHISYLDWYQPINTTHQLLHRVLDSVPNSVRYHRHHHHHQYDDERIILMQMKSFSHNSRSDHDSVAHYTTPTGINVTIQIKTLPVHRKPRDCCKFHAGSAILTFDTSYHAHGAMSAFLAAIAHHAVTTSSSTSSLSSSMKLWKVRWQPQYLSSSQPPKVTFLTEAQIVYRRLRAASYARQRQRVATETDHLLSAILQHKKPHGMNHSKLNSNLSITNVDVLDVPPSSFSFWDLVPSDVDPVRGGKLVAGSARGTRKQVTVEAFHFVLQNALLVSHPSLHHDLNLCPTNDIYHNISFSRTTAPTLSSTMQSQHRQQQQKQQYQHQKRMIADLGCGTGNLAISLAWLLQDQYQLLGVDVNEQSLQRLRLRSEALSLNVITWHQDLHHLLKQQQQQSPLPITETKTKLGKALSSSLLADDCAAVVSLHACGIASDLALTIAVQHQLPFAISPCCIGKVKSAWEKSTIQNENDNNSSSKSMPEITFPRSQWLQNILSSLQASNDATKLYQLLVSAADYGVNYETAADSVPVDEIHRRERCRISKLIVCCGQ
jgi:hypothetical protein